MTIDMKAMEKIEQMQKQFMNMQKILSETEVQAEAAGGKIKVKATADGNITQVWIDEDLMRTSTPAVLSELIVMALRYAKEKANNAASEVMNKFGGDPYKMMMNMIGDDSNHKSEDDDEDDVFPV